MKIIHKTKYKNLLTTLMISLIVGLIFMTFTQLLIKLERQISILIGIIVSTFMFYLIGRKTILRHIIGENFNIQIDFLFHPNHKIRLTKKEVKNIKFKVIDFGRYGL